MVIIMENKTSLSNSKSIKRQQHQQQQQNCIYDNANTSSINNQISTMKPENRYNYNNRNNNIYKSSSTFFNTNNKLITESTPFSSSSTTNSFTNNNNKMKQNCYQYNNTSQHHNNGGHYYHNNNYNHHYNNNYHSNGSVSSNGYNKYTNGNNNDNYYYPNDNNKMQSRSSYDLQSNSLTRLSPIISTPLITTTSPPSVKNNKTLFQRNDLQPSINSTTSSTTLYSYKLTNHLTTVDENEINNNNHCLDDNTNTSISTITLTTKSSENLNKSLGEIKSNGTLNNNHNNIDETDICDSNGDVCDYTRLINEMERLYPGIKWPLHNTWSFWYIKNDRLKKDWKDNLIKITDVSYIENFWAIFNYLVSPSALETGADLALFKAGVEPMWEDPENITGGRWLLTFSSQSRKVNELDEIWLNTILALIGDNFCGISNKKDLSLINDKNDSNSDHICDNITGICVQNRPKIDKLSLWTKNYKNEALTRYIGRKWKDNVHINQMITFEPHDSQLSKGSSSKLIYKE